MSILYYIVESKTCSLSCMTIYIKIEKGENLTKHILLVNKNILQLESTQRVQTSAKEKMHASTKLRLVCKGGRVVQYQGSLKFTMDLDLKIYVRMRRRGGGGSMGIRGAVLPGDFGGIRGLSGGIWGHQGASGGFPGASRRELTNRAPSLAL